MQSLLILKNAQILENYRELSTSGRQPGLAVYKENQLIIVNQKAIKCHEFVVGFFKQCLYFIYDKLGMLSYDQALINKIKQNVDNFYVGQCRRVSKNPSSDKEHLQLTERLDALGKDCRNLMGIVASLKSDVKALEAKKQSEDLHNRTLQLEIKDKIAQLDKLNNELNSLEAKETKLNKIKTEIATLQPILQENAKKVEQLNAYEAQISTLREKLNSLEDKVRSANNKKEAFQAGQKAERTALARRTDAGFPEARFMYCSTCVQSAANEVRRRRGFRVEIGPLITGISSTCQGHSHTGELHISTGYRLHRTN